MKNKNSLNYDIFETKDGSQTYFSHLFQEHCHSLAGASLETKYHYLEGCNVEAQLEKRNQLNILEVGFGTGLGYILTKEVADRLKRPIVFYSFEIDQELLSLFEQKHKCNFNQLSEKHFQLSSRFIDLNIIIGNARDTIKELKLKFDAIYQDAFSPRRNAQLWSVEWFEDLYSIGKGHCLMSTYSASSSIRKSMLKAQWKLSCGGGFGEKRASTRAKKNGETSSDLIEKLKRSPVCAITDDNYQAYNLDNRNKNEKNKTLRKA